MKKTVLNLILACCALVLASSANVFAAPVQEENLSGFVQTNTDVKTIVLTDVGENKVKVIKLIRDYLGIGLKEAHALVGETPAVIKENVPSKEAEKLAASLRELGAKVELKAGQPAEE